MYREILEARRISLGEDHPDTSWTHNGLGGLLLNRSKLKEAVELLEKSANGLAKSLGRSYADTLWVFHNLAIVYENTGKLEEAEKLHKEAFAGYKAELGMDHPDTLWVLNDLAACYSRGGKLVESREELSAGVRWEARTPRILPPEDIIYSQLPSRSHLGDRRIRKGGEALPRGPCSHQEGHELDSSRHMFLFRQSRWGFCRGWQTR